ncbi:MAG: DUF2959 domain-containing protein [Phycisphaerales bacterium]|nr:DUF2959 domain-containing protein [Phycisphaerales bacterium]
MTKRVFAVTTFFVAAVALTACRSAYYSAWESLGRHKRDLLQAKVRDVRDEQKDASQELKDALTRLKELTGFEGGELEKTYKKLQGDYDSAAASAEDVRDKIRDMDQIARDLFREWESELKSISSPELREADRRQLDETRRRYEDLYTTTKRAESTMEPVLVKLRDYVLYLKHNLNAQAIGALQGESTKIQVDISKLIEAMNASIREADEFLKQK